ncbi:MAG: RNA-binding S4 domain-containing protein [Candidatus Binatia bacterium]
MREPDERKGIRLDKWLWATRFFKTRSIAADAISGGKVQVNGSRVKPSREIHVGDELRIRRGPYEWVVGVRGLSRKRGPAQEAVLLYQETEQSKRNRETLAAQLHAERMIQPYLKGRPTKKARREIIRFTRGER